MTTIFIIVMRQVIGHDLGMSDGLRGIRKWCPLVVFNGQSAAHDVKEVSRQPRPLLSFALLLPALPTSAGGFGVGHDTYPGLGINVSATRTFHSLYIWQRFVPSHCDSTMQTEAVPSRVLLLHAKMLFAQAKHGARGCQLADEGKAKPSGATGA
jgi:hypothetical protein